MAKKRRQFDRAFKVEAVRLVTEERRPVAAVARDLGIGENLLHRCLFHALTPTGDVTRRS